MARNLQGNRDKEGNLMTEEEYAKAVPTDTMLDNIIEERGHEGAFIAKVPKEEQVAEAVMKAKPEDLDSILDMYKMTATELYDMQVIIEDMPTANPEMYQAILDKRDIEVEQAKDTELMSPADENMAKIQEAKGMLGKPEEIKLNVKP